jgi:hypothetical protein
MEIFKYLQREEVWKEEREKGRTEVSLLQAKMVLCI